ncbi:hypothetical protein ACO0QE_003558 [Hanseniaspora vineae]
MDQYNEFIDDVWSSLTNEHFLYGEGLSKFFDECSSRSFYENLSEETLAKVHQFTKTNHNLKVQKEYLSDFFKDVTNETLASALGFDTKTDNDTDFSKLLASRNARQNENRFAKLSEDILKPLQTTIPPISNPKLRSPFPASRNIGPQVDTPRPGSSAHRRNASTSRFSSGGRTSSVSSAESVQSKHRRTASLPYFNGSNFVNNLAENDLEAQKNFDGLKVLTLHQRRLSPSSIKKNVEDRDTKMKNMLNDREKQIEFLESELNRIKEDKMVLQSQYEYLTKEFEAFKSQYVVNSSLTEKLKEQSDIIDLLQQQLDPSWSHSKMSGYKRETTHKNKFSFFSQGVPLFIVCLALVVFFLCFRLSSMSLFLNNTKATEIDSLNASYHAVLNSGSSASKYHYKWFEKYAILTKIYWFTRDWFEPEYVAPVQDQNFQTFFYEKLFNLN